MLKFSSADFTFPLLPHEKALEVIALMEFRYVDIGLFEKRSHIQPSDQFDNPERKGALLADLTAKHGLEISDIFFQAETDFRACAINHPDKAVRTEQRELFLRGVAYARAAGCCHFSALPGVAFDTPDSHDVCKEELAWRVEHAKKLDVVYAVEPHLGSIMSTPETALAMLREVPGLTIALDHSHFTYQGYNEKDVWPLVPFASHVHARGAAYKQMQTSVCANKTDFKQVVSNLKECNYDGVICIEYTYTDWEDCNQTDNISESILLRDQLKRFELKQNAKE